jgi:hypothetical protein
MRSGFVFWGVLVVFYEKLFGKWGFGFDCLKVWIE